MADDKELQLRYKTSREDAADHLQELADQLRMGELSIGGEAVAVPEQVLLEVESHDGEVEFELRWGAAREDEEAEDEGGGGGSVLNYVLKAAITAVVTGLIFAAAKHFLSSRDDEEAPKETG